MEATGGRRGGSSAPRRRRSTRGPAGSRRPAADARRGPLFRRPAPVEVDQRVVAERLAEHRAPARRRDARDLAEGALENEVMEDAVAAHELERVVVEFERLAVHHAVVETETREGGRGTCLSRRHARGRDVDAHRRKSVLGEHEPGIAADPAAVLEDPRCRPLPGARGRLTQNEFAVEAPPASRALAVDRVEAVGGPAVGIEQRVVERRLGREPCLHLRFDARNGHKLTLIHPSRGRIPRSG